MIAPNNGNNEEPESQGGTGGEYAGELLTRRQINRLDRKAMREHWPLPDGKIKAQMVERQVKIAIEGEDREATSAYKAVLATAAFNAQADEYNDPADETNELPDADARTSDVLSGILHASPALVAGVSGNGKQVDTAKPNSKTNGVPKPRM